MEKYLDEAGLRKVASIRNGDKEELKESIRTNKQEADEAIAEANEAIATANGKIAQHETRLNSISSNLTDLQGRFNTQAETIGNISKDLNTVESDIDSLESRLDKLGFKKAKDFVCNSTNGSRLTVSNWGGDMRNFRVTGGSLGLYRLGNVVILNGIVNVAWDSGKPMQFKLKLFDGPNPNLIGTASGDVDYQVRAKNWGVAIANEFSASDPANSPFGATSADMVGSVNWDNDATNVYRLLIEPQPGEQVHVSGMGGPSQWAPASYLLMTPAVPRNSINAGSAQLQIRNCCWVNQNGLPSADSVPFN